MRPLGEGDYAQLRAAAADPLIWEQHPVADRYKEQEFRRFFDDALRSGGALAVLDLRDGALIGTSRFDNHDGRASEIEIGWTFLARAYWGGAHNKEMKRLMLAHAFEFVENVVFLVGPRNLRSQKAVEKIGAVPVGTRRDAAGRPSLLYRITKLEWAAGAQRRSASPARRS